MTLTVPDPIEGTPPPADQQAAATPVKPATVGRTVHYYPQTGTFKTFSKPGPYAALVCGVNDATGLTINLHAFHNSNEGMKFVQGVPHKSIADADSIYWDWAPIV